MSETIGTINLEETSTVTWPIASGYTNSIKPNTPSDKIMNKLGVHFYRLGATNFNEDHQINTDVIDRLADFNVCVILDLRIVWINWRKRNGHSDDYYVFDHLGDFEEAIEQAVNRIQPHITNKKKFWVNVWNEPDWWLPDSHFWKGNLQDFKNTWRTAYNKLRGVLLPEQKILGPALSGFYYDPQRPSYSYLKIILDWMNSENLLPDHISYHYPGDGAQRNSQTIHSWGYDQTDYIGEYLGPVPDESYGRPGKFVYDIAAFTYGRITGGAINPTPQWGGYKGMGGLLAVRNTNKLTNLGYVCKLYTEATSINNRPVACVLDVIDAGDTKIFATRRDNKTDILMGTCRKDPLMTQLRLYNAENYNYKITLWIIPFSAKNDPFDESDLIKPTGYPKTISPVDNTLTIDVTAWSERENGSKNDACYIEVEKTNQVPLSVYKRANRSRA